MRAIAFGICYNYPIALRFLDYVANLGKGEVESSILSCSTIFPKVLSSLAQHPRCSVFAAWQNMDGTDRDLASTSVQNACNSFLETLAPMATALLPHLTFDREAFMQTPRPYTSDRGEETSLYVIRSADYCKVGIANNVQKRLESFRAGNPHTLTLERSYPFASRLHALLCERTVHKVLEDYSVGREWFHVDPKVAKNAATVVANATYVWVRRIALEEQRKRTEHIQRMHDDPEYRAHIEGQYAEMKKRWAKEIKASESMREYRNALWDERKRLLSQDVADPA